MNSGLPRVTKAVFAMLCPADSNFDIQLAIPKYIKMMRKEIKYAQIGHGAGGSVSVVQTSGLQKGRPLTYPIPLPRKAPSVSHTSVTNQMFSHCFVCLVVYA